MTARDDLLDALLAERYNGGGWATPVHVDHEDNELSAAVRRKLMAEDFERANKESAA